MSHIYLFLGVLAPLGGIWLRLSLARSVHRAIIAKPGELKEVSYQFGLKPRLTARWRDENDLPPPPSIEGKPID